jgi:hypothetical protein
MDFLDTAKLLRTAHLDKVIESLSCNEDSNAKDSIYSKSTSLDVEESDLEHDTIFGESYEKSNFFEFETRGNRLDRLGLDKLGFDDRGEESSPKNFFDGFGKFWKD